MNDVIVAYWRNNQRFSIDKPWIVKCGWVTFAHDKMDLHWNNRPCITIPMKEVHDVSVVGQYDTAGREWFHHWDYDHNHLLAKRGNQNVV
jgi:hypothetical protein